MSTRILLVADHPKVAAQVKSAVLGLDDYEVFHVSTPQRAVALVEQDARSGEPGYDVVVGDNDTHPTGGLALCREVKALGQMGFDVPPVVLLIARPQDAWLADWAQADARVLKPPDPFDLREALDAVVAGEPVPALPGIGSNPKPSLLDREPGHELAARTDRVGADPARAALPSSHPARTGVATPTG